jgi:alpha-beta hydrolase superfamily lysophospholipase
MSSTTEIVTNHAGLEQLRRRWVVESPRGAVLLVHGVAEHSGRYEYVGEQFAAAGFDTLAFDLRGHGETAGPRGHVSSFAEFLDDVEELLGERRGLGVPVVLVGHSLGGLICTAYAASDRPEPDLLVLSAPALHAEVPGWQRSAASLLGSVLPKLAIPNDFDGALLSRDEAVGEAYRVDPLRVRKATARFGKELFAAMPATSARVQDITVPTYVLHGSDDRLVPPSASEGFDAVPAATRVVHDGLRHECLNEPERDEVIAGLLGWLDIRLQADALEHAEDAE